MDWAPFYWQWTTLTGQYPVFNKRLIYNGHYIEPYFYEHHKTVKSFKLSEKNKMNKMESSTQWLIKVVTQSRLIYIILFFTVIFIEFNHNQLLLLLCYYSLTHSVCKLVSLIQERLFASQLDQWSHSNQRLGA